MRGYEADVCQGGVARARLVGEAGDVLPQEAGPDACNLYIYPLEG